MSFPWKKLKKTSISQLVKDHIHSQSPFMVETGFPSSLVDLFVKNRRKFMKSSKKKRAPPVVAEPPLSSLWTPPSPVCCITERSELKGCQEKDERFDLDEAVDKNMVFIALLKVFLVVVLVLGTKKLVMGITMSVFLLYFFEYSGKHVYRWIMPVAGAQRRSLSMVQQGWRSSGVKMVELEEKDCVFKTRLQQEELSSSVSSRYDNLICEGIDSTEEELRSDLLESKRKKSQKSKIKRFIAKKFRRKTIPISESDVKTQEKDKLDCQKSSEKVLDATIVKVSSIARKEQSSASIDLLLVVLVGLIGGRIFALVFTVTWCMMSKQVLLKTLVRIFQLICRKL
ncbi:uncharacterized protein LOC125836242 [Solanum verrucosum]|uniref:uncharacterized protein LOC125836242 n=1 Tax=Solanum verrucosum TaxID=315347 RepID=UPI0020D09FC2|nr:uncharacterized protein LOC125836242 [Solanum verrucosum]